MPNNKKRIDELMQTKNKVKEESKIVQEFEKMKEIKEQINEV